MDPQRGPASAVNPAAGAHKVTGDPAELEAASRAAHETWNAFPYYEARFGERGRRFGFSDAGWLVTLCGQTRADASEQVHWLAVVLSSRGMPSVMLEHHLGTLCDGLRAAIPERESKYDVLRVCARELKRERRTRLSDARVRAVAALMPSAPVAGIGELLASAAADEANGIPRAVRSMEEWLCSAERFEPAWIDAVERTIAAARAAVSKKR